jgi:hypothetical protein
MNLFLFILFGYFFFDKKIVYFYRCFQMLTKATADGTLYKRDWDIEPLFPLPNADAVNKEYSLSLSLSLSHVQEWCKVLFGSLFFILYI